MVIEEALTAHLKADAGVTAVFGGRVYPNVAPQNPTYPLIVYQRIDGPRVRSNDGPSHLAYPRFQFMLCARTYPELHGTSKGIDSVRLALDGFQGTMGGGGGVDVDAVFLEGDEDDYDDELQVHWARMDFTVWHHE